MIYIPDFFTKQDADRLSQQLLALPHEKMPNIFMGKQSGWMHRHQFPTFSAGLVHRNAGKFGVQEFENAPACIREIADAFSDHMGNKRTTYISTNGYFNGVNDKTGERERSWMNWHNHKEDIRREKWVAKNLNQKADMSVMVANFGCTRTVGLRPYKNDDPDTWTLLRPTHGSVYILESEDNRDFEHGVLDDDDDEANGWRISCNAKWIEPEYAAWLKAQTKSLEESITNSLGENGPHIFCTRAKYSWPDDSILVDRSSKWGNEHEHSLGTQAGRDAWDAEVATKMENPAFGAETYAKLRGKHLRCWCIPGQEKSKWCHATWWLKIVNA
jgi:hypothetical protein